MHILTLEPFLRFDGAKKTEGIKLKSNCRIARKYCDDEAVEWVYCDRPSDRFEVRVRRNPKHKYLGIGFAERDTRLNNENWFSRHSWLIYTGNCAVSDRNEWGPKGFSDIDENSVVSITKDFAHRTLVFRVDGMEPREIFGRPYGRRITGLSDKQFSELLGVVEMRWKDDAVEIVQ